MSDRTRQRTVDIATQLPWLAGPGVLNRAAFHLTEKLLGYHRIDALFARAAADGASGGDYLRRLREVFEMRMDVSGPGLEAWPKKGPVLVAANHPFGGADAICLGALAFELRPDTRLLANEFLAGIAPLREALIPVNVFGGAAAARRNARGLREAVAHLGAGGQLVVFPAGEVGSWTWSDRRIVEKPWAPHLGHLLGGSGATVVPAFLPGRNSGLFQALGAIHPLLRTAWLGRELLRRRGSTVSIRLGQPRLPGTFDADSGAATEAIREAVMALRRLA
ncbi:MAG: 1-acyl-sn-glycerol-3-phosphate acyltransferase [Akkermansiaceae bacterium]|nr:1-acyl-sn-glycerol-3-phosphate acyltransferase [Akkermansiaceae bacterium]MCP5551874.1 1-acyl-sn-glycerol-3-phosphate acyltransferase [Akkermansiaceae bacterium]